MESEGFVVECAEERARGEQVVHLLERGDGVSFRECGRNFGA